MIGEAPRHSVIVAAYNAAQYIGDTIVSVFRQTEENWQLIVVDDGSTDATARIVSDFDDERVTLIRQENHGVAVARNTGFSASSGEYALFLDADDILFPDALTRLGLELDAHPEAVLAYGTCMRFESAPAIESTARQPLRRRRRPTGDALASLLTHNPLLVGAVLARSEAIRRTDGFDAGLSVGEDWVFWCELATLGAFRYVGPKPIFAYRWHSASRTRKFGSDPRAGWPVIDLVFSRDAVRQRFSDRRLLQLRRQAEAWTLGVASRELLRAYDWRQARQVLWSAVKRDPASLGDWFFLPFAMVGWLPPIARKFLD